MVTLIQPNLSQQAKTRGHRPTSVSMPGYSVGQAAPDLKTGFLRFMASQGTVFSRLTFNVFV